MLKIVNFILKITLKVTILMLIILTVFNFADINISVENNQYLAQYTYYYPGDATGSGGCTGSGKCIDSFTTDENGWYFYETNGEKYLVIAAALNICKNSANHCGIDVAKHGIAQNIRYYNYFDILSLNINGKNYKAMVLDACGACMWKRQDTRGQELFDIYVKGPSSTKPGSSDQDSTYIGNGKPSLEHFGTTYTGDIKQGWIYERFEFKEVYNKNVEEYRIESNINEVVDEIFNRAKTSYFASYYEGGPNGESPSYGYSAKACSELDGKTGYGSSGTWKQGYDLWKNIPVGSGTLGQIGCLVTSIAIQLDRMGIDTGIDNFNPGTFACYLSKNGKFTASGLLAGNWNDLFPNVSITTGKVSGSKSEQASQMQSLINQGCYLVIYAPHSGSSHFVAVSGTSGDNINIIDPGAGYTKLWGNIYDFNSSTSYRCLKAS